MHAKRFIHLFHRWCGVGVCVLMLLWILSGVIMLFAGYPKLLPWERLAAQAPLLQPGCCVPVEAALALSRSPATVREIGLTSIAHRPVYRLKESSGQWLVVDALTGQRAPAVDAQAAAASAQAFLPGAQATVEGQVADDRWTHSGALDLHRPLFQVQMDDAAATRLYVSSATGEVVMDAPRAQRAWNFVGAWLHWLYMFRDGSKDPVWNWLLIGLSAAGTLSAFTGALAGLWRWRFAGRYKSGSRTPYREFHMRWHHVTGLVFGTVLATWVFSGLMSMNPFGVFDAKGQRPDLAAYRQGVPGTLQPGFPVAEALARLRDAGFTACELEWRVLAGQPYLLARDTGGKTKLVVTAADGAPTVADRLAQEDLVAAARHLMAAGLHSVRMLHEHDAYFYQRQSASMYGGREQRLPVLRLDFNDPGLTTVYIDPHTGDVALSLDRSQRLGRWLFNFLHSWDLPAFLHAAAVREVVLILLSLGAMAIAATGFVIGWRRLRSSCLRRHGKAVGSAGRLTSHG